MQILLPHPPAALNPNGNSAHYMGISAARKKARAIAAAATVKHLEQEVGCTLSHAEIPTIYNLRHTTPTTYRIIWNHWGTQQPDDDNVVARIKSYKDGITAEIEFDWVVLPVPMQAIILNTAKSAASHLQPSPFLI